MASKPPTFQVSVWSQPPENFAFFKSLHVNTLINYDGGGLHPTTLPQWCDAATQAGLYYWLQADHPLAPTRKGDPNLLGWMMPDEPNGVGKRTPGQIVDLVLAAKMIADLPVAVDLEGYATVWQPESVTRVYVNTCDVVFFDFYEVNYAYKWIQGLPFGASLGNIVSHLRSLCNSPKRIIPIMEWGNIDVSKTDWAINTKGIDGLHIANHMRGPTADEIVDQYARVEKAGIDGIGGFSDGIGKGWESYVNMSPEEITAVQSANLSLLLRKG